jgi:recombination protein RecA
MRSAAQLRQQIESRLPVALSPRARVELVRVACGVPAIDALLHGGLPEGVITEFAGPECSGRTTMALSYAAALTRAGKVLAWVDVADALDPESAAANGVDLERLLWVRCGPGARQAAPAVAGMGTRVVAAGGRTDVPLHGGCGLHPRSETVGMPEALTALLASAPPNDGAARRERKKIGTPGVRNRPLASSSRDREEQVTADRLPPRRGDNLALEPRCAQPQMKQKSRPESIREVRLEGAKPQPVKAAAPATWQALDQALRAADLLLQAGGFAAIVLDMGSVTPEAAWRIPMATWFRFRAACDRGRTSLLLLTRHPCARSSAELVVRLEAGSMQAESRVLTGMRFRAETERSRTQPAADERSERIIPIRKPPLAVRPGEWRSEAPWIKRG